MNSTRALIGLMAWQFAGLLALLWGGIDPHGVAAWLMAYIPAMIIAGGVWLSIAVAVLCIVLGFAYGQPCGRAKRRF